MLIDDVLAEIFADLKDRTIASHAVPEHLMVLRSFQFVAHYRKKVCPFPKSCVGNGIGRVARNAGTSCEWWRA